MRVEKSQAALGFNQSGARIPRHCLFYPKQFELPVAHNLKIHEKLIFLETTFFTCLNILKIIKY